MIRRTDPMILVGVVVEDYASSSRNRSFNM